MSTRRNRTVASRGQIRVGHFLESMTRRFHEVVPSNLGPGRARCARAVVLISRHGEGNRWILHELIAPDVQLVIRA